MVYEPSPEKPLKRRRGRPPGGSKGQPDQRSQSTQTQGSEDAASADWDDLPASEETKPLSLFLQSIMRHDRHELARVARELDVAENTVYRWLNGTSEPRVTYVKRLPDLFPEHRAHLIEIINQAFGDIIKESPPEAYEVDKEIYRRALEMAAQSQDEETHFWSVTRLVFDHALQHLDPNKLGLAITYAKLMSPREDGIHSLHEVVMQGHYPWSEVTDSLAFLGSTTLAGLAATSLRTQTWNDTYTMRALVEIDENERSACAIPITRHHQLAGVLIISSTQPTFFDDPQIERVAAEYGLLMGIALQDREFHPPTLLQLRPMPNLVWQRSQLAATYTNRFLAYAQEHKTPSRETKFWVQHELELEFEEEARTILEQRQAP